MAGAGRETAQNLIALSPAGSLGTFPAMFLQPSALALLTFGEAAGRKHLEALKTLAAQQGHVVVRVGERGKSYRVLVLDDSDESMHGAAASSRREPVHRRILGGWRPPLRGVS